jgi:hypothetical protein
VKSDDVKGSCDHVVVRKGSKRFSSAPSLKEWVMKDVSFSSTSSSTQVDGGVVDKGRSAVGLKGKK